MTTRPGSDLKAWCDYPPVDVPHAETGPLAGCTLAVKDIYPVAGYKNGWGSPTRLSEAEIDRTTQPSVQKLLEAGAKVVGKSQCDELCFSLNGVNAHYGAPVNGAAPERITGGSSSGSASLVSNGIVDIATGSDTGGSVRAPASYCRLIGLRTTHGRLSLEATMPLAPSFDCFGWFARDVALYARVGEVLLGNDESDQPLDRLIGLSALDQCLLGDVEHEAYSEAVRGVTKTLGMGRHYEALELSLDAAYWTFRRTQGYEAWQSLGPWIESRHPHLGPGVRERFDFGRSVSDNEFIEDTRARDGITRQMEDVLGEDGLLIFPTSPSCAPLREASDDELQAFREQALKLLCLSGLTGLPQITVPLVTVHGAPMGVSFMGPRGSDRRLIEVAERLLERDATT